VAAGILLMAGDVFAASALGNDGDFKELGEEPSAVGALLFWIWMLAAAIVLWRYTPKGPSELHRSRPADWASRGRCAWDRNRAMTAPRPVSEQR
jgi:hypothetical protein